jgi:hypoxanthine phosphoribosyltransferase
MDKLFIKSEDLLSDAFKLAWKVFESGYKPNYIVGVWRGGAPIGIAVQELLSVLGIQSDHIAIRTSYYKHHCRSYMTKARLPCCSEATPAVKSLVANLNCRLWQ